MRPTEPHYITYPPAPPPGAIHRTTSHTHGMQNHWQQPAPPGAVPTASAKRYTSNSPPTPHAPHTQPWTNGSYGEYPSPTSPQHDLRRSGQFHSPPSPAAAPSAVAPATKCKTYSEPDDEPTSGKRGRSSKEEEEEAVRILEERRKRNANASARFRKRRNERERELIDRCLYMEQKLLEVLGQKRFAEVVEKAPAAAAIEGVGKRVVPVAKNAGLSIDALTSAPTVEDVWETCEKLKELLNESMDRIQRLEEAAAKK
ncbi:hypothetical protein FBU59_000472 [Linderina macrospora]|uniref:Uncharacterized protein n=1 Tax=Linderina macrospora TaxID=4868 RepID=A0ACC1JGJ0_9FUNG|nr:hypothetical protein FBU59_000472 [Linderina macrospora]